LEFVSFPVLGEYLVVDKNAMYYLGTSPSFVFQTTDQIIMLVKSTKVDLSKLPDKRLYSYKLNKFDMSNSRGFDLFSDMNKYVAVSLPYWIESEITNCLKEIN
jgi:hypothetical protein